MLENEATTTSLNILASIREPLNLFEIEDYFIFTTTLKNVSPLRKD